jgi:chorismate mutase
MSFEQKLNELRLSVDETDELLYNTILKRVMLISQIGLLKKEYGVSEMCEERRNQILSKVKQWAIEDQIPVYLVSDIFEKLIDNSVIEQVLIIHEKE